MNKHQVNLANYMVIYQIREAVKVKDKFKNNKVK